MKEILSKLYNEEGQERIGFILNNRIIEVENSSSNPFESFVVSTDDILKYCDIAEATWHTHPNSNANISNEDFIMVQNWPNMLHYIIGKNEVRCFKYDKKKEAVIEVEY